MSSIHDNDRPILVGCAVLLAGALAYGVAFDGWILALLIGVPLLGAALAVALASRGGVASRLLLPMLGMALAALAIQVARGRTEAHFAVFAFLACTVVYRHWLPVLSAAATIAVHHLAFNTLQQWGWGPMCFTEPSFGRVVEHALYVVAEAAVLVMLAQRAAGEFAAGSELSRLAERLVGADGTIDFGALRMHSASPTTQRMLQALRRIEVSIETVRNSSETIGSAAAEVAGGSRELSSRTEQTASSLQQTAASMEELTGTVDHTASSARSADQLAASAASVAQRGGQIVGDVVATMAQIHESSRRIADIIGVIDGIAFQTNILALNAAVEAARAGEQGRGFAVVAGEVRSLAQRSAEAAREIRSLIGSSVERAEVGARLVTDAGRTMEEIVQAVQRVSTTIAEISTAAGEQSAGIGQVNGAIAQLDEMTQQNAALVEQSSAAAESLREQSRQLAQAVSAFRLASAAAPA